MTMSVPDYQTLMRPSLEALADGHERTGPEVRDVVAAAIGISDQDRDETIKSGAPVFDSRVQWAITYLSQAGLINRPKRGVLRITDRGRQVLAENSARVDNHVLMQFDEFRDFKTRSRQPNPSAVDTGSASVRTEGESLVRTAGASETVSPSLDLSCGPVRS
jgi:restriction system protein